MGVVLGKPASPRATGENTDMLCFRLDATFIEGVRARRSPFEDNVMGEYVFLRTYSRNGEEWYDTVRRVVEGTYSIQKRRATELGSAWDDAKMQRSAQKMYDLIFDQKFLPPGRGLWTMGTKALHEKNLGAAANNCAFVSTDTLRQDPAKPFAFLMDASMLGVGVGFDTEGAGQVLVRRPAGDTRTFVVADSREGWVESLRELLYSYTYRPGKAHEEEAPVAFDYSLVRPAGTPLRTFGGVSSGPKPLKDMHDMIRARLDDSDGQTMSSTLIVDIFNVIGKCVVSGNIRRSAEIAFGSPDDVEFLDLKDYSKNPHRQAYGWTSNNSVFARVGMDYSQACERVVRNGEPGFAWLENMRAFSRMNGVPDHKDAKVQGANPCNEQSLEPYELCCLVETFPDKHDSYESFERTVKYAFLYAKTVTLLPTHWEETNAVMSRNRRIGCSVSGLAQFLAGHSLHELRDWLSSAYDAIQRFDAELSSRFAVPLSIKTTSVKPSGTVSLLAGATPGMHYPESRYYIRRIRDAKDSPLVQALRAAGYKVEPCVGSEDTTEVVEIPVCIGERVRTKSEVSMWEQLALASFLQRHWADNQVSCTVSFDPVTEGPHIKHALDYYQYELKGVSFLPNCDYGCYAQMPYEAISGETYAALTRDLQPVDWSGVRTALRERSEQPSVDADVSSSGSAGEQGALSERPPDAVSFCDSEGCALASAAP